MYDLAENRHVSHYHEAYMTLSYNMRHYHIITLSRNGTYVSLFQKDIDFYSVDLAPSTAQKMKFSTKDFFIKCD